MIDRLTSNYQSKRILLGREARETCAHTPDIESNYVVNYNIELSKYRT